MGVAAHENDGFWTFGAIKVGRCFFRVHCMMPFVLPERIWSADPRKMPPQRQPSDTHSMSLKAPEPDRRSRVIGWHKDLL